MKGLMADDHDSSGSCMLSRTSILTSRWIASAAYPRAAGRGAMRLLTRSLSTPRPPGTVPIPSRPVRSLLT